MKKVEESAAKLLEELMSKKKRNQDLKEYYEGSKIVKDLGTIVPPNFHRMKEGLGWCQIAIDSLAERISLFSVSAHDREDSEELEDFSDWIQETLEENAFEGESEKAIKDFLLYGVCFIMIAKGDTTQGFPETVITVEDPNRVYGIINPKTKLFEEVVRVVSNTKVEYHTRTESYFFDVSEGGEVKQSASIEHGLGECPIIPIVNRPDSEGWGSSDLSKNARLIFDRAQRTLLRLEIASERYSIPQRYVLGASKEDFSESGVSKASVLKDPVIVFDDKESDGYDGTTENSRVSIGTLSPSNPESFIKPFNNDRAEFAIACSIPDSYMGIEKSNPSSADAIRMAESRLIKKAEKRIAMLKAGLKKVVSLLSKYYDGALPAKWSPLITFDKPHTNTEAASVDAVVKLVQVGILPKDHTLTLQRLGYSAKEIESIQDHVADESMNLEDLLSARANTYISEAQEEAEDEA